VSPIGASDLKAINRFADASGRLGETLYATRCLSHGLSCSTAFTSLRGAYLNQADTIASSAFAGGLAGILIGLAFSFRYTRTRELKQQLRRAAEGDELSVAYQPIVDLETRQIVGAEALARWKDEEGNEVKPDVFIKIAEEFGFVGAITKTVLKRTLEDFAATLRERPDFRISINVAAADLSDPKFVPMLEESLKRARVKPKNLAIELTERSAADSETAMETIRTLRKLGHSIHIDDFGTGYSNLDKLLYLFADTIKIDKAFTGGIGTESASATILPQILAMAESLNLEVVVEGVETFRQADYFNPGHQKIYAQGWLYGRPVTAPEFLLLLADEQTILTSPEAASAYTTRPGALRIVSQQVA
jgi:sensor c-di-GMP phosphodiesterase-like protein